MHHGIMESSFFYLIPVLKGQIGFILLTLVLCSYSRAQSNDSVKVSGKVKWKDATITGYPPELEIVTPDRQVYFCPIDSTGSYVRYLPVGTYLIKTSQHYNWMGEEYIRINNTISNISINVSSQQEFTSPILVLDTIAIQDDIPKIGVARNFTKRNARLLDDFIKRRMAYFEIPGASLAIIKNGELIYCKAYGVSNILSATPVTKKTLFESGSVTKSVFAFVVMRLVEKGVLELDQPLYQLLPFEGISHDERYKLITTRHVLCHQTGLPNWAKRDSTGHFNLLFTPGTGYGYSGEGYEYLKRVIEHVTKKDISQILNEELMVPLDLKGLYFSGSDFIKKHSAHGHLELQPSDIRIIEKPMMAFSMFTEAKSFSDFMLGLRNRKGLGRATYDEMLGIQSTRNGGKHWGLGFELENSSAGLIYGHSGSTSTGFICSFRFFSDLDIGYVFFTNSDMGAMLSIPLLTQFLVTGKK
jgi:CubicO group peptidase (beta-lactamase class C family)